MPTPDLLRLGIETVPGAPLHRRAGAVAPDAQTPLIDLLPNLEVRRAWFTSIPLPAAYAADAGLEAWYPIGRFMVPDGTGEDMALYAVSVESLPTDPSGDATPPSGTAAAWGRASGSGAAIVVNVNLPVQDGAWTSAPFFGAGVGTSQPITSAVQRPYLFDCRFPPSSGENVPIQRHSQTRNYAPAIVPLRAGESLDVALVVAGQTIQAEAGADVHLVGEVTVTLHLLRAYVRGGGS